MGIVKSRINLVFHKIVYSKKDIKNQYDFCFNDVIYIIKKLKYLLKGRDIDITIFFDDGYKSQYEIAIKLISFFKLKVYIALISNYIGKNGYLSEDEIFFLEKKGVIFCSHGFSHAALGKYNDNKVLNVPIGGIYRNLPLGHKNLLSTEEIRFQVIESFKQLYNIGIKIDFFVLPYGIYNYEIKKIIKNTSLYKKVYSCDDKLENINDENAFVLPRFLMYNDISFENRFLDLKRKLS